VRPDTAIQNVARQAAREFQLTQDHLEAVDHFNPRTDLAPVIAMVAASTASNANSVALAACCSGVGAGGETGSGEDGSGDCVMDTSDSGAGGSASGIAHTRGTGNSGYSGGVSGQVLLPLLLLITSILAQISLPSSLWLRRPLPLIRCICRLCRSK